MTTPAEICERPVLYCLLTNTIAPSALDDGRGCTCCICRAARLIASQAAEIERLNGAFRLTCAELQWQITRAETAEAALEKMRAAAEDALPILERDRQSLVECCSNLRENASGGIEVVPDTLDPDAVDDVAAYDDAISRLRALTTQESEMDDRAACKEENGDEMCDRCDCWKQTRANCS